MSRGIVKNLVKFLNQSFKNLKIFLWEIGFRGKDDQLLFQLGYRVKRRVWKRNPVYERYSRLRDDDQVTHVSVLWDREDNEMWFLVTQSSVESKYYKERGWKAKGGTDAVLMLEAQMLSWSGFSKSLETNPQILKMIMNVMDSEKIKETGFVEIDPFDSSRQISPLWERPLRGWWTD